MLVFKFLLQMHMYSYMVIYLGFFEMAPLLDKVSLYCLLTKMLALYTSFIQIAHHYWWSFIGKGLQSMGLARLVYMYFQNF